MDSMEVAGDGAWRERAQQLARDFELLQEDSRALRRAFEGAAADLAFQQECQAVMIDKLTEIRLRRLHEFLRAPESAKMLFMEEAKPSARRDHPTMPRRELHALLAERWEALAKDELNAWESRFREYASQQGNEQPGASKKKAAPKLSAKTAMPSKRKGAAHDATAGTPKKRKTAGSAGATSPSPSPSTPSKKRAKASKATVTSDVSKALDDLPPGASDSGTPTSSSKASKGSHSSKPSPQKKATTAATSQQKASPSSKGSKAASTNKARSAAAKTLASTKKAKKEGPAKKAPATAKKATKKAAASAQGREDDEGDYQRKRPIARDYSASDEDDDDDDEDDNDDDEDEDENESLSGGSPSDDDSDDNMAQLPTGAFG